MPYVITRSYLPTAYTLNPEVAGATSDFAVQPQSITAILPLYIPLRFEAELG